MKSSFYIICLLFLQVSAVCVAAHDNLFDDADQMIKSVSKVNALSSLKDTLKHPQKMIDSLRPRVNCSGISVDTLTKSTQEISSLPLRVNSIPKGLQTTGNYFEKSTHEKADHPGRNGRPCPRNPL